MVNDYPNRYLNTVHLKADSDPETENLKYSQVSCFGFQVGLRVSRVGFRISVSVPIRISLAES